MIDWSVMRRVIYLACARHMNTEHDQPVLVVLRDEWPCWRLELLVRDNQRYASWLFDAFQMQAVEGRIRKYVYYFKYDRGVGLVHIHLCLHSLLFNCSEMYSIACSVGISLS